MKRRKKEIEIKLLFKNKKKIISLLLPEIKFEKKTKIKDRYYSQEHFDMRNIHELIRIREYSDRKAELTYKGRTKDSGHIWERKELTSRIESPEIIDEILLNLGFHKIREYFSKREYWHFNGIKITFSNFIKPKPLKFLEIEGNSKKKIKNVLKRLGDSVQEVGEEIFAIFDKK